MPIGLPSVPCNMPVSQACIRPSCTVVAARSRSAQWLFQHHRTLKDGTIVWPTRHETGRNRVCLMTQSLAIQTLILYGQIFKSEEPIALAEKGAAPFLKSNQNGGFLIPDSELTWFEKRRANASPRFVMLDQMAALTAPAVCMTRRLPKISSVNTRNSISADWPAFVSVCQPSTRATGCAGNWRRGRK